MKLLFIQGGTRLKQDDLGNWYTDGNFNDSVWKRYTSLCDELIVLLRKEDKIYSLEEAEQRFNKFDTEKIHLIPLDDLYTPIYRIFDRDLRKKNYKKMEEQVKNCDRAIIRSIANYYTATTLEICKKLNKPYAIEVTGVGWDGTWYHGMSGKPIAFYVEQRMKKAVADAPYALYVTQEELQKRYPCSGKTVGCSNVELDSIDELALNRRQEKITKGSHPIIIGTIGGYQLKTKGQVLVIKALGILKKKGVVSIKYQLVGGGDSTMLLSEAKRQRVEKQVEFLGSMPHNKVFEWLDQIDIYIQPSYQEGLCRSVVEAMSRACPVICSDACGERELADERFIFKRGDWKALAKKITDMISSTETLLADAERGCEKSKEYKKEILDERRRQFYLDFIDS